MILGSGSRDLQTHQGKSWPGMHRVWTRVDSHLISLFFCLYDDISLRSQVGQRLGANRASEDALMLTYFSVSIKGLGRLSLQLLPLRRRLLRLSKVCQAKEKPHRLRPCRVCPGNMLKYIYTEPLTPSEMSTRTATIGTQASHRLHPKLSPVPDLDNRRFCRACQCTLPVSAFPSGTRRYLCKRHIWERIQQPSKRRTLATNSHKKLLWMLWKLCWSDAKRTFKHERILLLQRDIEQTLAQIEESSQDSVSPEPAAAKIPAASKWHIALMPANPEHKLSRNNVVVVDKTTRRVLLQAFRQGGVAKYIAELGTVFP